MLTLSLTGGSLAHAAPPALSSLFPAGGQQGTSFPVTTTGNLGTGTQWWTDASGVAFHPGAKANQWQASVASTTPPGLYQVRAFNAGGASAIRWFSVGRLPEISETEPNDEVGKGHAMDKLPVCVNARLDKGGDVDGYQVVLKSGETLVGMVEAYALGSLVDIIAHVVNQKGERVLTASDARNLDPFIVFKAPSDGTYTVQLAGFAHPPVANVAFTGGPSVVYRLHLSKGPVVTQVYPAVISPHAASKVTIRGYNLDPAKLSRQIEPSALQRQRDVMLIDLPESLGPLQAVPSATPAMVEKEPNNTREQAMPVKPGMCGGQIQDKGDVDRFVIDMKKGQRLQSRIWSGALGLPVDATVRIEAPDGKALISADDDGQQPDPRAIWTAGADGPHQIVVQDTLQRFGPEHGYVLEITEPLPAYEVSLENASPLILAAGKTVSIKVKIRHINGHKDALITRVANLPPGVHAPEVEIPEKGSEVEIKLHAATNAAPGNQPFTVTVWSKGERSQMQLAYAPLRGENLRGTSLLDSSADCWLTVTAAP